MLGSSLNHLSDVIIFNISIFIKLYNFFKKIFHVQLKMGKLNFCI